MTEPYEFLRGVLTEHQPAGWAIEFGVYSGQSLALIAEHMPVIGLDSFEGLPEDWRPEFPKGSFGPSSATIEYAPDNAMLVTGWFEDTLPVLVERGLPQIGLVHIDCDLYSSTKTALRGLVNHIHPGTIVVFDEYHGYEGYQEHEAKAWAEFVTETGVITTILGTGEQERAFRIEEIPSYRMMSR